MMAGLLTSCSSDQAIHPEPLAPAVIAVAVLEPTAIADPGPAKTPDVFNHYKRTFTPESFIARAQTHQIQPGDDYGQESVLIGAIAGTEVTLTDGTTVERPILGMRHINTPDVLVTDPMEYLLQLSELPEGQPRFGVELYDIDRAALRAGMYPVFFFFNPKDGFIYEFTREQILSDSMLVDRSHGLYGADGVQVWRVGETSSVAAGGDKDPDFSVTSRRANDTWTVEIDNLCLAIGNTNPLGLGYDQRLDCPSP